MSLPLKYLLSFFLLASTATGYVNGQAKRLIDPDGDDAQYYVERWTTDDGLPANTLLHILKSRKGYIWIGCFEGLVKFDGIEFKGFNRANSLITSNAIAEMVEDSKGKMWISTYGEGIMSYENRIFKSENDPQLENQSIQKIFIDSKDWLWIGTRGNGLFYHDGDKIRRFDGDKALQNITVSAIAEASDGSMWFGTEGNGIVKYKDKQFKHYTSDNGLPENKIFSLYQSHDGSILAGTSIGLARLVNDRFMLINEISACLINIIFEDPQQNMWVATDCGLFRKQNADDKKWVRLPLDDVIPSEFFTDAIIDKNGDIWLATYHAGLAHIKKSKFINYTERDGLATKAISTITEYNEDTYLIGANNGKINLLKDGQITDFDLKTDIPDTRIRTILYDSKGNLWVGTSLGMLLKEPSGKERWFDRSNGLPDNEVRIFFEDNSGTIWFGTRSGGLVKITDDQRFEVFDKDNGLNSNFIMSIQQDNKGNLIIGTNESGINIMSPAGDVRYRTKVDGLPSNLIFNTYTDADDVTWIATNAGLCRWKDDNFFNISAADGLATDAPFDVVEDNQGNFWIPTSKGLVRADKSQLNEYADSTANAVNFRLYDKQDGLEVAECTGAAKSIKSKSGKILVPALNGIFVVKPEDISKNDLAPPVFITQMTIDGQIKEVKSDTIKLKPDIQRITISYEALNYTSPAKVRYKFMLEGFDKSWVNAGNQREAQYTNLHYGTYTFKVIAQNEDGVWNDSPSTLTIVVSPHFYETTSFLFGILVLLLLVIFGIFRFSVYNVRRRNKMLSNLVNDQTSELREINTTLEEQKEELLLQHDLLAQKNLELEKAHVEISDVNDELLKVNFLLEEKVEERTKDLSKTLEMLRATNEELDTFIYRASHDLKGPTASLLGLAMLGKIISEDDQYTDFFHRIEETSHNMNNILGKLISMHVILQSSVSYTSISITNLIKEIEDSLKVSVSNYQIVNKTREEVNFHCDHNLMKIILTNLVENALIFNDSSKPITVDIDVIRVDSNIHLIVEDNGDGIDNSIKNRIFDLFYRGSQKSKGNGLGLYLVKKAIDKLEGQIEVETEKNSFTKFTIILPIGQTKNV